MTEKLRTIDELTTSMEIRRTDGTWVRVADIDPSDDGSVDGIGIVGLIDGRFTIVRSNQAIMSREVAS
jgi:hypothetical protein